MGVESTAAGVVVWIGEAESRFCKWVSDDDQFSSSKVVKPNVLPIDIGWNAAVEVRPLIRRAVG